MLGALRTGPSVRTRLLPSVAGSPSSDPRTAQLCVWPCLDAAGNASHVAKSGKAHFATGRHVSCYHIQELASRRSYCCQNRANQAQRPVHRNRAAACHIIADRIRASGGSQGQGGSSNIERAVRVAMEEKAAAKRAARVAVEEGAAAERASRVVVEEKAAAERAVANSELLKLRMEFSSLTERVRLACFADQLAAQTARFASRCFAPTCAPHK